MAVPAGKLMNMETEISASWSFVIRQRLVKKNIQEMACVIVRSARISNKLIITCSYNL